jgi:hypothetical protein
MATDVEYVARVVVERIERKVVPSTRRGAVMEDPKVVRDKAEIASFSIRGATLASTVQKINGMVAAALVGGDAGLAGDPVTTRHPDDDEEDEEF